jgi:hypothetical protein
LQTGYSNIIGGIKEDEFAGTTKPSGGLIAVKFLGIGVTSKIAEIFQLTGVE